MFLFRSLPGRKGRIVGDMTNRRLLPSGDDVEERNVRPYVCCVRCLGNESNLFRCYFTPRVIKGQFITASD